MGFYTQGFTQATLVRLSDEQRAILQVLTVEEIRPLEAVILSIIKGFALELLVDGWHAPYTPLPGPSL